MNLRKIRLNTICLYSDDSTLPRSLFAASQSVSSNDFSFFFAAGFLAMFLFAMRDFGKFYIKRASLESLLLLPFLM